VNHLTLSDGISADAIFGDWLKIFGRAITAQDYDCLEGMFSQECYLRDLLALTWDFRFFEGRSDIRAALQATLPGLGLRNFRVAADRSGPLFVRRSGKKLVEGYFQFDSAFGVCDGFVRLQVGEGQAAAGIWHLVTVLNHIHDHGEKIGRDRPTGDRYSRITSSMSWREERIEQQAFADRDPEVLIIGAGQSGLMLAARLKQMGVDVLVVEKTERIGDEWRHRYNNLTLHN